MQIAVASVWAAILYPVAKGGNPVKYKNLTLCAMLSALACVVMLTSYFPYMTYGIPAIAGLFVMIAVIETDLRWSLGVYASSSIIVFIIAEPEAKIFYVMLFGLYPILKSIFERTKSRVLEYVLKFAFFNVAALCGFGVSVLLGVPMEDMGDFGKYTAAVLLVLANIAFLLYDFAITRVAAFYIARIAPSVSKIFKGR